MVSLPSWQAGGAGRGPGQRASLGGLGEEHHELAYSVIHLCLIFQPLPRAHGGPGLCWRTDTGRSLIFTGPQSSRADR